VGEEVMSETASSSSSSIECPPAGQGDYVAQSGDCIESIAQDHGFFWETLWNDGKNSELKQKRKDPNILMPGDRVHIPEKRLGEESGATEQKHRFKLKGVPAQLRLKFFKDGKPRKNEPYTLWIDGIPERGTTDGDGMVIHPLMPSAIEARLRLGDDSQDYIIKLGHLDPVESPNGLRARLRNLGYYSGDEEGPIGPQTKAALRSFQVEHDLPATGESKQQTLDQIATAHGS
jgi:hypothetical protein